MCVSHSFVFDSLQPHGLQPTRLFYPWDSPGKNSGVGSYSLLQGIFLTQGSNTDLLHCKQFVYHLRYQGSPKLEMVYSNFSANLYHMCKQQWRWGKNKDFLHTSKLCFVRDFCMIEVSYKQGNTWKSTIPIILESSINSLYLKDF